MKLIIAGSRYGKPSSEFIAETLKLYSIEGVTEIVSGTASGVDEQGEKYAGKVGLTIQPFYPDWGKHGKAAGPIRNREMADYADALLLIWDGESKGSASMRKEMLKQEKPVYEVILRWKPGL